MSDDSEEVAYAVPLAHVDYHFIDQIETKGHYRTKPVEPKDMAAVSLATDIIVCCCAFIFYGTGGSSKE
jgi:hypothetical protein